MPYCSQCGVEVDKKVEKCPLCGTEIQRIKSDKPAGIALPSFPKGTERAKVAREILSMFLLPPILIVITVNLVIDKHLSWSIYPTIALGIAWIYAILPLTMRKYPIIIALGYYSSTAFMLWAIDFFEPTGPWFWNFGLPLITIISILVCGVLMLSYFVKEKGMNIMAFCTAAAGIFCIALDMLIAGYLKYPPIPTWSVIVAVALIPLTIFLLYYHYRLRRRIDTKRYLHM